MSPLPTQTLPKNEIKPLTGFRGVAAVMIMLYHFHFNPAFADDYFAFTHRAYLSVDLFFVLSGFALSLRYRSDFDKSFSVSTLFAFMVQRIGRIYPAYIFATCLYFCKWFFSLKNQPISINAYDIICNIFLLQGWGVDAKTICGPTWSVSTELFAYVLFPTLIFASTSKGVFRMGLLSILAVGGVFFVAGSGHGVSGALDVVDRDTYLPLVRCLSEFYLGLVAYEAAHSAMCKKLLSNGWSALFLLAAIIACFLLGAPDAWIVLWFPFLVIALFYNEGSSRWLFGNKFIHWLGVVSYSLYLFHPFMRDVAGHVFDMMAGRYGITYDLPFLLAGIVGSFTVAAIGQRLLEAPGRRVVEQFVQRLVPSLPLYRKH